MKYLAVLGRQPEISVAELVTQFGDVRKIAPNLAVFESAAAPDIDRLGGTLKLAVELDSPLLPYLLNLPSGKITIGFSDYTKGATARTAARDALHLKKSLVKKGRSVRLLPNNSPILSTAATHHNHLGKKPKALEIIRFKNKTYLSLGAQNITAYAARDQARPARDAKIGMLPPKLAQILINLCGPLPPGARILDPFCGTGVLLQEAYLLGYTPYGTDKNPKMVDYAQKNLAWLTTRDNRKRKNALPSEDGRKNLETVGTCRSYNRPLEHEGVRLRDGRRQSCDDGPTQRAKRKVYFSSSEQGEPVQRTGAGDRCPTAQVLPTIRSETVITVADATNFTWGQPIDAVACEAYLGTPMSAPPTEMKLKQEKQICQKIIRDFLKNLAPQIKKGTPLALATPAWRRPDDAYSGLNLLDDSLQKEYNEVKEPGFGSLLYHREGQVVARQITVLRKR